MQFASLYIFQKTNITIGISVTFNKNNYYNLHFHLLLTIFQKCRKCKYEWPIIDYNTNYTKKRCEKILLELFDYVTDVTGRADRGTRQTCKRGQEQD